MSDTTLKLETTLSILAPKGTRVITNDDEWVTLARKQRNSVYSIFTCLISEVHSNDLFNENVWIELRKEELEKILAL